MSHGLTLLAAVGSSCHIGGECVADGDRPFTGGVCLSAVGMDHGSTVLQPFLRKPSHLDVRFDGKPSSERLKEGLRTRYDHLRHKYPETWKMLVNRLDEGGTPQAPWEAQSSGSPGSYLAGTGHCRGTVTMSTMQGVTTKPAFVDSGEKDNNEEEYVAKLRRAKNYNRNHVGGAYEGNLRHRLPPAQQFYRSMPRQRAHSSPALRDSASGRQRSGDSELARNVQEEKETLHTMRLAKGLPRNQWFGTLRLMPDNWEKI